MTNVIASGPPPSSVRYTASRPPYCWPVPPRQSVFEAYNAFVERLSDNDSVQSRIVDAGQRTDIIDARYTARSDHVETRFPKHVHQRVDVRSHEHAIARNISINNQTSAQRFKSLGEI